METPRLVLGDVVFIHGVLLLRARSGVIGRGVHAPEMLGEEIFAVEVVVVDCMFVVGVDGSDAEVAAPEAELDVLRADVSLPFVLGGEGGLAAVGRERTREVSLRVAVGMVFGRLCSMRCGASAASLADSISRCCWCCCRGALPTQVGAPSCTCSA